ncbi:MAG: hypothetical protein RLZZ142_1004 [Verrucomicrobiota bacterium]|jgi:uncharacterized metal-binding protein YceD (DUF177 family)
MKIHILQIPDEGKHLEGEDPASVLELGDSTVTPVSGLHYVLDVGLSDGGLFATGSLRADFRMQCVTCLEHFETAIQVPDFACQVELTGREEVDLTDILREDILLALPPHPHCDGSGDRVCPGAPKLPQSESPTEPPRKVWGDLDRLEF